MTKAAEEKPAVWASVVEKTVEQMVVLAKVVLPSEASAVEPLSAGSTGEPVPDQHLAFASLMTMPAETFEHWLDFELVVADCVNDFVDLLGAEIFRARIRVDVCLLENATGSGETNPVNVGQRRFDALVRWNFNSE